MPNQFQKSIQDYISKIKKQTPPQLNLSSSSTWMLRGCKIPKTPSFAIDDGSRVEPRPNDNSEAATLSDIERFLHENFKSLYLKDFDQSNGDGDQEKLSDMTSFDLPRFKDALTDIYATRRFPKGSSSSSSASSNNNNKSIGASEETTKEKMDPDDFITILTYSLSPHNDFRRSMQEIIEARLNHNNGKINWEFMEELLFCYLNLNQQKSYKYILRAFVDLVVSLRENSNRIPTMSKNFPCREGETEKKYEM